MVFTNVINPRSAVNRRNDYMSTIVKKGASIGANATIVCGNDIGKFSFIGAGAVVTKEVLDYSLVVGNPSKQIGWVSEYGDRLEFNKKGILSYSESIDSYNIYNKEKNNLDLSSSDCFILPFDFKEDEILSNSYIGDINIEFNFLSQCMVITMLQHSWICKMQVYFMKKLKMNNKTIRVEKTLRR